MSSLASSDEFGLGFTDMLFSLIQPVLENEKLIQKIDFDYAFELKTLFPESNTTFFAAAENIDE